MIKDSVPEASISCGYCIFGYVNPEGCNARPLVSLFKRDCGLLMRKVWYCLHTFSSKLEDLLLKESLGTPFIIPIIGSTAGHYCGLSGQENNGTTKILAFPSGQAQILAFVFEPCQ